MALSAEVAWAKRTVVSGSKPWQKATAKPALKASPQPQVHFTLMSKAGTLKRRAVGVMIIGAVGAEREDAAALTPMIDEILRHVVHVGEAGEGLRLLDRGHEIIDMRQDLRDGRQIVLGARKDIERRRRAMRLGGASSIRHCGPCPCDP